MCLPLAFSEMQYIKKRTTGARVGTIRDHSKKTNKSWLESFIMKNLLWFTLVGALLLVAVAEEFDEIEGDEDDLVNEEEFYGSGTGPSLMVSTQSKR